MFANAKNIQKPKRVLNDIESSPEKDDQKKKNTKLKIEKPSVSLGFVELNKYAYDPSKVETSKQPVITNFGISNNGNQIKMN